MRPIQATMNLAALVSNLAVVRRHAPRSSVWAVVKADAYGHGLLRLLPGLQGARGADGLALLELDSALAARQAGYAGPVLLLEGFFTPDELPVFAQSGFTAVVHSPEQLAILEGARLSAPVDVYVKFNTGMNRLGFAPQDAGAVWQRLSACANVGRMTLMTHFADADGTRGVVNAMDCVARLEQAVAGLKAGMSRIHGRSYANSAAILRFPETHADWVRPGIMLYGCTPFGDEPVQPAEQFGLNPVMTLKSRIIAVQDLRMGNRIGYGGSYTAQAKMRVGVVACGYADGYPRHAPGSPERGTPVLVNGRRTRTVGRVSMDMLFVDLTTMPDAGVGSEVVLWGEGLSADEVAAAAGTVSYELLCGLTRRVPVAVIA